MTVSSEPSGPAMPGRDHVRSLFDWLAPNYDAALLTFSLAQDLRWKSVLLRKLNPRAGERALDLACGTGLLYDRLARRLGPRAVVGLDVNRRMLASARRAGTVRQFVRADAVRLPFRPATFDLVTAGYLFKYVPLDQLARELRRVLRPGGRCGGYDFSAPLRETVAGRTYDRFLHDVLPQVARHWGRGDEGWAALMEFLGLITSTSGWETRIEPELRRAGFDLVELVPSLGGAITWVWARLPDGETAALDSPVASVPPALKRTGPERPLEPRSGRGPAG